MEKRKHSMEKHLCLPLFSLFIISNEVNTCIVQEVSQIRLINSRCIFSLCKIAGYKHFGFLLTIYLAPYYSLKDLCIKI